MKNKIPDRWEAYSPIGSVVPGTRFIAFKVPLKPSLLSQVPEGVDNSWGIAGLLNSCPNLGLVIDLTFTYRYYNGRDLESKGVEYRKIMTAGHEIPTNTVIRDFTDTVDTFLAKDENKIIGVHCTHGLNRTGYLICRYMVEKLGFQPEEAIAAFDKARGHTQERINYLTHIRTRAWEKIAAAPAKPPADTSRADEGENDHHGAAEDSDRSSRHSHRDDRRYRDRETLDRDTRGRRRDEAADDSSAYGGGRSGHYYHPYGYSEAGGQHWHSENEWGGWNGYGGFGRGGGGGWNRGGGWRSSRWSGGGSNSRDHGGPEGSNWRRK